MTKNLIFEIGTEEIPSAALYKATDQLKALATKALDAAGLAHGEVETCSTPRRMILSVKELAEATEAIERKDKGPAAKIAFDADGNPTKAAEGFARGKGLTAADLTVEADENGAEYVYAVVSKPAVAATDLLCDILSGLIRGLSWPRSQRWAAYGEYFVRPVRWIVAMLDDVVLPVSYAGAVSGNATWGHRVLAPGAHEVATAADLLDVVRAAYVIPTQSEREQVIRDGVASIEKETGFTAELPAKTLLEVVNLSEYPQPLVSEFDEEFLQVPEEIIVDAMLMHQRYFPLYDANHKLTNKFIIVSNGNPACAATIIDGNERVVRARLDDAKFFYEEDLKNPLEYYVEKLDSVVFQESLGTVKQKAERLVKLAEPLAVDASLSEQDARDLVRAAYLCKADLVTNAVIEFTSVQGVMGSYYATASGETEQVAQAIGQHYQPRFAGDVLPDTTVGKLVALADKLDTICGLFAVGQGPTGSSDPFALRRSAIGIVNMLEAGVGISLSAAIDAALANFAEQGVAFDLAAVRAEVVDFFVTRTKVMLRDAGIESDTIDAVLGAGVEEPAIISQRAHSLENARKNNADAFDNLATAFARANNLRDAEAGTDVDVALLSEVEAKLNDAVADAEGKIAAHLEQGDYETALEVLASLRAPIDAFFADVMVMDEDLALRANRMRLLNRFVGVFANIADFGKMAKSGK